MVCVSGADNMKFKMKETGARLIAVCSVAIGLSTFLLMLASILPAVDILIYCIVSVIPALFVIEGGYKSAVLTYIGTVLLCLIILPNKMPVFPYLFYFGYYAMLKGFLEKNIKSKIIEYIVKIAHCNIVFYFGLTIFSAFLAQVADNFPVWALYVVLQPSFLLYDYTFTKVISYYSKSHLRSLILK